MWLSPSGHFPLHVRVARAALGEGTAVLQSGRRRICYVRCCSGNVTRRPLTPTAWKSMFNTPISCVVKSMSFFFPSGVCVCKGRGGGGGEGEDTLPKWRGRKDVLVKRFLSCKMDGLG